MLHRSFTRKATYTLAFFIGFIIAVLLAIFSAHPAHSQDRFGMNLDSQTAPVILDGRLILKVSNAEGYPAQFRANLIESKILEAARSPIPIEVTLRTNDILPTLWLNDGYLLTVTERDTDAGNHVLEQAQIWQRQIQLAINRGQRERTSEFMRSALLRSLTILLLAIFIHWTLGKIWKYYFRSILSSFLPQSQLSPEDQKKYHHSLEIFINLTLGSVRFGLWLAIIIYIANQFPITRQWSYQIRGTLLATLTSDIINLDNKSYSIPDLLVLLLLLWALVLGAKLLADVLRSRILQATGIGRGAQEVIAVIVKYSLISIGTIVLLQVWGLNLSSLTILASAFGVGIGFGFQDIAKNFGSGLVLLFERPIQIGDFIEVGEYQGTVERVGARSTVIKTLDRVSIIVPNSRFLESELINWDHDNSLSGLRLPLRVAYGSDVELVRKSLLDVAQANSDVLTIPSPQVLFKGFGDSSLNFELRVWTRYPNRQVIIKSDLYYQIDAFFRQRHIEIPFPQRDLHIRGQVPLELSPELEAFIKKILGTKNQ
ncbi:MAG: mechanosensitive ion channel domain-containing protein [Limnospira maxima]|uniref:MscS Mechanosensitive ion channel n=2 Tax=Limnospira TaxID=2596745 RepID=A0A9P1NYF0_9CYAN|nr:MscS Mechanosensitive ion channel [Limnospira indica PCC 8005]